MQLTLVCKVLKAMKSSCALTQKAGRRNYWSLTLKWSRPSALPLVVKGGGSLWTLTQKSTFPKEFGGEMRATDKVIQKNQNTTKNRKSDIKLQNGGQKTNFYLAT